MDFLPKLIFFLAMIQIVLNECCVKFTDGKCVECPKGMHLFRDNCIYDVENCQTYKDGFDCDVCKKGFELKDKKCVIGNISSPEANQTQIQTDLGYKVVTIDFKNLSSIQNTDLVDEFTISDEIFKSNFDKDLKNTQIVRADQRIYTNGTITIVIEYRNKKNESFEGEMLVNLKTFIFKIVDWKKSASNDTKGNSSSNNNNNDPKQNNSSNSTPIQQPTFTISFKPFNSSFLFPESPFTSTQLDLSNPQQIQQMALLDQQSSTYLQEQLKTLPNNTITIVMKNPKSQKKLEVTEMEKTSRRVYKQKNVTSQFIVLFYKTSDKNVEYIAVGQVSSNIKEGILPVKLVYAGFDQTLLEEKKNVTLNTNTTTANPNTSNTTTTNTSKPNTSTNTNSTNTSASTDKTKQSFQQLISKMTFTHIKDDVTLLNDIFYMITKDEIVKKNKMFEDLEPEKVERASLDDKNANNSNVTELKTFNYYRITYVTGKNQTYQVVGHCNIVTYDPFVDEVKLLGQNTTETNKNSSSNASQTNTTSSNNTSNLTQTNSTTQNTSQSNQTKTNTTQQTSQSNSTQQNTTQNTNVPKTNQTSQPVTNSSSNSSVASNQSSSTNKFVVPEGFISVQKQSNISANVYYLIAMDTLSNRDRKFFDLRPTLVYTKEQPSSNKIQFFMKFEIAQPIKTNSTIVTKQIWAVSIEVTKSSFKAQILKNQLIETTSQPINYKQQSEQVQQLKKDDLITKNTTSTVRPAIGSGKVILLRQDKDRILFGINSQNDLTIKSTKNLRSTE